MEPVSVREFITSRLGVQIVPRVTDDGAQMGAAAARILIQDSRRLGFLIINLSANDIYITPVGVPSATHGILVARNGGSVSLWCAEDGEITAWEWFGIATAAASNYMAVEYLIGQAHTEG